MTLVSTTLIMVTNIDQIGLLYIHLSHPQVKRVLSSLIKVGSHFVSKSVSTLLISTVSPLFQNAYNDTSTGSHRITAYTRLKVIVIWV